MDELKINKPNKSRAFGAFLLIIGVFGVLVIMHRLSYYVYEYDPKWAPVDYGKLLTGADIAAIRQPATIDFHGDVVGSSAWKQGRKGRQKDWEKIKLRADYSHFNARGHYLQACVWIGFLFDADPTSFTYCPAGLPESDAKLMRECARDALAAAGSKMGRP